MEALIDLLAELEATDHDLRALLSDAAPGVNEETPANSGDELRGLNRAFARGLMIA